MSQNGGYRGKPRGTLDSIKLFIGQVPKSMDAATLRPYFAEFGEIEDISVIKDKATQAHRGCAFVTYTNRVMADACIEAMHNKKNLPPMTSPLQIKYAEGEEEKLMFKLFVGMVPKSAAEGDLRAVFEPYGTLEEIYILRNAQTKESKGCAFIKYQLRSQAQSAIDNLNGNVKMEGSNNALVVKYAENKKKDEVGGQRQLGGYQQLGGGGGGYPAYPPNGGGFAAGGAGGYPQASVYPPHSAPFYGAGQQGQVPPGPAYGGPGMLSANSYQYPPAAPAPLPVPPTSQSAYGYGPAPNAAPAQSMYQPPPGFTLVPNAALQQNQISGQDLGGGYGGYPPQPQLGYGQPLVPTGSPQAPIFPPRGNGAVGRIDTNQEGPPGSNLFVYHIPTEYIDQQMAGLFSQFGTVISAKIFRDKSTGQSKGFGFVSFDNPHSAEKAIAQMNGTVLGGKKLKVQHKKNETAAKPY